MPPEPRASLLQRGLGGLHRVEDLVLALLLSAMILIASAQIALRNLFDASLVWGDPFLRMLVLWVGLLGALAASRGNQQITVDVLSRLLTGRLLGGARATASLFTAAVSGVLAFHAGRFVAFDREAGVKAVAALPAWLFEIVMPVAFALIAVRYLLQTASHLRDVWQNEVAE
ncbi:MAG: TRAP transporter small permease [Proteobacteria bacterium]|nr:TRAP transporter small permease [Pseudomonadota bacterium]